MWCNCRLRCWHRPIFYRLECCNQNITLVFYNCTEESECEVKEKTSYLGRCSHICFGTGYPISCFFHIMWIFIFISYVYIDMMFTYWYYMDSVWILHISLRLLSGIETKSHAVDPKLRILDACHVLTWLCSDRQIYFDWHGFLRVLFHERSL